MKRILVLLPESIAGKLIIKSFASGFQNNKCLILYRELEDLTAEDFKKFRPDMVFGYDYSYFMNKNAQDIVEKSDCKNLVFYFGDEPKSKFALGERNELYEKLKKINSTIFIWDKDFVKEFENSYYLPLGVCPEKYAMDFSGYKHQITFVGRPLTEHRQQVLSNIIKSFKDKLNIFCYEKHFLKSIEEIKEKKLLDDEDLQIYSSCWRGFAKTEKELAYIYNTSKININITEQGISSINYRVFEVLAAGGFLLTDERTDINKYFKASRHLETYKNTEDMIDEIDFYLQNLNIAQKIAILGRSQCVKNHTFSIRAKEILNKIF